MSCSIVPISFSRTMATAVRMTSDSISKTQMMPGTMNFTLRSSGLNQMRGSTLTAGWRVACPSPPRSTNTTSTAWLSVACSR